MSGPDGTVSLDVVPNLKDATTKVEQWGDGLKPVKVPIEVDASKAAAQIQASIPKTVPGPFGGQANQGFAVSKQSTSYAADYSAAASEITKSNESIGRSFLPAAAAGDTFKGSVRSIGPDVSNAAQAVSQYAGGLDSLVSDLGTAAGAGVTAAAAIEATVAGFGSAFKQLEEQKKAGVDLFGSIDTTKFKAAFDTTQPGRFYTQMESIKRVLGEVDAVGPITATDKIKDFFGLFDDGANRADVAAKRLEEFQKNLDGVSTAQARQSLDYLKPGLQDLVDKGKLTQQQFDELYAHMSDREAIDRAIGNVDEVGTHFDSFGFQVSNAKSQVENWSDSLGKAFNVTDGAIRAGLDFEKAKDREAAARKKLADIESGTSDALTSARQQLVDADKGLTKAIQDNADQQKAAFDKLQDAQDRLAAAREKGAALASGGVAVPGIDRSVSREIGNAERDVEKAKRDLEASRQGSDAIASAKDRVAQAQRKVNDEESKVGPNSEAAKQATDDLNDAVLGTFEAFERARIASARLDEQNQKNPEAVKQLAAEIDKATARGEFTVDMATRLKNILGAALSDAQAIGDEVNGTLGGAAPTQGIPNRNPDRNGGQPSGGQKRPPLRYSEELAAQIGLDINGPEFQVSDQGIRWQHYPKEHVWVQRLATGGLVRGSGSGDTVPAMLTPGEIVLKKSTVDQFGAQNLLALNAGRAPQAQGPDVASLLAAQNAQLAEIADLMKASILRPNSVVANIDASGSSGMDYAGMSRALADAGFK